MADQLKTTVYLNRSDYLRLQTLARQQGRSAAELVREAVGEFARRHAPLDKPSSLGAGHSGTGTLSEEADDLLEGLGTDQ